MQGRGRFAMRVLVPIALGVLVVTLAVLQYRWLGQVSEIQRQEMRAALERRSADFAEHADREIGAIYTAVARVDAGGAADVPAAVAESVRSWRRRARFPGLVRHVYLAGLHGADEPLEQVNLENGAAVEVPWPGAFRALDQRFARRLNPAIAGNHVEVVAISGAPFVSAVPALVVWLTIGDAPGIPLVPVDVVIGGSAARRAVIVEFDRDYLREVMLAGLLTEHFDTDELPARVQIVDMDDRPVMARGLATGDSIAADRADVTTAFFLPQRDGAIAARRVMAWVGDGDGRLDGQFAARLERQARVDQLRVDAPVDSWFLRVQHGAGSLDVAVADARRRNLYLSFGILSVLAASIGLVLMNARRAEQFAAQRMEFVAAVTHELRTPLSVIRAAADNISAGIVQDPEQTRRYGELIGAEGRRLTGMVEQVLARAGLEARGRWLVRTGPTDVAATLRRVVETTAPLAAEANCTVDVDVQSGVPQVNADEAALQSAVENLVSNALKHARDGRSVRVTARLATGASTRFLTRGRRPAPAVEIAVVDRGPGIDPADRAHIFEPFYRGRAAIARQVPGSGLGLNLVKQSVEDMGGRVSVESAPGGGARFVLLLPAAGLEPGRAVPS